MTVKGWISPQNRPCKSGGRGGIKVYLHSFSSLGARWGGWSTPRSGRFTPRKVKRYPLRRRLGGLQGLSGRSGKNLAPTGFRSPDRPNRSESLYRLSYPGPPCQLLYTKQMNKLTTLKSAHNTECSGPIYADRLFRADSGPSVTVPSKTVTDGRTDGRTVGHGYPIMPSFDIFCANIRIFRYGMLRWAWHLEQMI